MILSAAGGGDEDALYAFLTGPEGSLAADNNTFGFPLSETRIRDHIRAGLSAIIRDDQDKIVASIGGIWDRFWFSDMMVLGLMWLFVHPDYRGRGYDDALLAWFKEKRDQIAAEYGKPVPIVDVLISEKRLPAKLRLWRRHGRQVGGVFLID